MIVSVPIVVRHEAWGQDAAAAGGQGFATAWRAALDRSAMDLLTGTGARRGQGVGAPGASPAAEAGRVSRPLPATDVDLLPLRPAVVDRTPGGRPAERGMAPAATTGSGAAQSIRAAHQVKSQSCPALVGIAVTMSTYASIRGHAGPVATRAIAQEGEVLRPVRRGEPAAAADTRRVEVALALCTLVTVGDGVCALYWPPRAARDTADRLTHEVASRLAEHGISLGEVRHAGHVLRGWGRPSLNEAPDRGGSTIYLA